jgi:uncharacterized protein (TIGR03435 family)
MGIRHRAVGVLCILWVPCVFAQTPKPLAFEVASVKPDKADPGTSMRAVISPGDRLVLTDFPLELILGMAFQHDGHAQVIGAPGWVRTERFDINAKAAAPATTEQLRVMLQTLLADRFGLVVHHEIHDEQIYSLVLARADGKLGPNLHTVGDCVELPVDYTGPRTNQCGIAFNPAESLRARGRELGSSLAMLRPFLGRRVVDKTGLAGRYDFELTWGPQDSNGTGAAGGLNAIAAAIFTGVQEQLGLKLVPDKDVQDVVVIDKIEHPTED